jgi:K+-transporting ATPase KdpF subunit
MPCSPSPASASSFWPELTPTVRNGCEERHPMTLDYLAGGVLSLALLGYLVYALLCPERF